MSHAQVVEDKTSIEGQFAHHFGDRLSGFLKGLEDANSKAPEASDVFGPESRSDLAAILIVIPVDDVVNAFDAPMPAVDGQYAFGRSLLGCAAGNTQCGFKTGLAGFLVNRFPLDAKDLSGEGKVQVVVQCSAAPDAAGFDAAMLDRGGFDEIRRGASFEQQSDIAFQLRLVALDREMIVRPLLDDIVGYECGWARV